MERFGLGIPKAWIQHEQGAVTFMSKQQQGVKQPAAPASLVCKTMQDLDISSTNVRLRIGTELMLLEEKIEDERFPLTPLLKTRPSDDFMYDDQYDYIILPLGMGDKYELRDGDIIDDGGPKAYRNNGETRRTLNEFYRKLCQFNHLRNLSMAKILSSSRLASTLDTDSTLTRTRRSWRQRKIKDKYQGSNEGEDEDDDEDDNDEEWKGFCGEHDQPSVMDPNRVSKLKALLTSKNSIELGNLDEDLYEWFMKSGFRVDLVSDELDEMYDELSS
ncbi:hypothetical protein BGZ98_001141 [Dissophora globulifera]|nr:hypothetical protein BGZ98_001141 [Dissophora globulifera]